MPRIFKHLNRIIFKKLNVSLSDRTVQHSGLAEPASSYTAALDLKGNTVLGYLYKRNDGL